MLLTENQPPRTIPLQPALKRIEARMQPPAGDDESAHDEGAPVAMTDGPSGVFVDFDLLPDLLASVADGRAETIAAWSALLAAAGLENEHLDADGVQDDRVDADRVAADAWRFAERMGLIGACGATADGRDVAALAGLARERRRERLAPVLTEDVAADLGGRGGISVVDLMRRAARSLAETDHVWARECPGLIPVEIGAIAHWARVNPGRAEDLVANILSWRDVAMHRYEAPDPAADVGSHAVLHYERVSEFYLEHPWLAGKEPLSYGEEVALAMLLAWCGLLGQRRDLLPLLVFGLPTNGAVG